MTLDVGSLTAHLDGREVDLGWSEALHPRGHGGKFARIGGGGYTLHAGSGRSGSIRKSERRSMHVRAFGDRATVATIVRRKGGRGYRVEHRNGTTSTHRKLDAAFTEARARHTKPAPFTARDTPPVKAKVGARSKRGSAPTMARHTPGTTYGDALTTRELARHTAVQAKRAREISAVTEAQREQARRLVSSQGLGTGRSRRKARKVKVAHEMRGSATRGLLHGAGFSSFSEHEQTVLDLAHAAALDRGIDIDLGWTEALHPRDFRGRFMRGGGGHSGAERHAERGEAQQFLGRHTRAAGMAKLAKADKAAKTAEGARSGDSATASAAVHARAVLDGAKKSEPEVTKDLVGIVGGLGGSMERLMPSAAYPGDFRLKTHGSLTRKIRDKAATKYRHLPPAEGQAKYAGEVGDALRYTALFDNKTFTRDVKKMLTEFEGRGYKIDSVENTFARGQAYSGVNINLVSPNGQKWELQAHTDESIKAKHLIHDDYEIYRSTDPKITEPERVAAYNRMVAVNRNLVRPPNFDKLGQQIHRPDQKRHREVLVKSAEEDLYRRGQYPARRGRRKLKS